MRPCRPVRVQFGGPNWTVDSTIFEMWLGLGGSPRPAAARLGQDGCGAANAARAYAATTGISQWLTFSSEERLEEHELESGPCR